MGRALTAAKKFTEKAITAQQESGMALFIETKGGMLRFQEHQFPPHPSQVQEWVADLVSKHDAGEVALVVNAYTSKQTEVRPSEDPDREDATGIIVYQKGEPTRFWNRPYWMDGDTITFTKPWSHNPKWVGRSKMLHDPWLEPTEPESIDEPTPLMQELWDMVSKEMGEDVTPPPVMALATHTEIHAAGDLRQQIPSEWWYEQMNYDSYHALLYFPLNDHDTPAKHASYAILQFCGDGRVLEYVQGEPSDPTMQAMWSVMRATYRYNPMASALDEEEVEMVRRMQGEEE